MGLSNEDAIEDAVSKIEQYRQLFGAAPPSTTAYSNLNPLNKLID